MAEDHPLAHARALVRAAQERGRAIQRAADERAARLDIAAANSATRQRRAANERAARRISRGARLPHMLSRPPRARP